VSFRAEARNLSQASGSSSIDVNVSEPRRIFVVTCALFGRKFFDRERGPQRTKKNTQPARRWLYYRNRTGAALRAVFPAAHLRALSQFTFLAGTEHRFEGVSSNDFRAFPAHRNPWRVRESLRIRGLLEAPGRHELHRQCKKDLVGHSATSLFQHDRIPDLWRAIAGWMTPSPWQRSCKPS